MARVVKAVFIAAAIVLVAIGWFIFGIFMGETLLPNAAGAGGLLGAFVSVASGAAFVGILIDILDHSK